MNKRAEGTKKEDEAAIYLENQGYKIIEKNFRTRYAEIDIIAEKENVLTFVEVKYRKDSKYGTGQESVTKSKCKKIYLAAQIYLTKNKTEKMIRFDVIAINGKIVEKYENFFWGDEIGF